MATSAPAFAGQHQPKPLRFDPAKLDGLSERLIQSHWENNYGGSVKTLNLIETRLAGAVADPDYPPAAYGGLKREELLRTGSVVLHEIYFDGLGGNGQPGGSLQQALAAAFGSFDTWQTDFKRSAMALGGGSGWVILAHNQHTGQLHNYWSWDHMHGPVMSVPLLVLDMYEHSYQMDYGAAAAKYIDAFLRNVDCEVADQRFAAAR
ncbi:superoxide dismutase [Altererythrobacter sp. Root672]|uniref:superoxide dismutase n=1 Tax=Altererythrobacter sp. Root672 TaxID=1736584 RepID=UPI001F3791FE|nr:Fe-Mn family superoxide dismutase [Altererythrobacter sp. Root672]